MLVPGLAAVLATGTLAHAAPPRQAPPPVRLAAAVDCSVNPNCVPGFRRVYHFDPSSVLVPLTVADSGIQALDDGLAEVAVAFSSNPQISRPDIVTLRDDRDMITPDHVVPVVRNSLLRAYGSDLRRRLNAASRLLTTLTLRGMNQQVIDGRLPEAVGGELIDANGLGGVAPRRHGPLVVIGYQDFAENETLAYFYAEALRSRGYRTVVRSVRGLRPEAVKALQAGRIGLYPGYSGSLLGYLGGSSLRVALARRGAQPLTLARAQDRNQFVMKADVAQRFGIAKLSDLARYWPAAPVATRAAAAPADPLMDEQWAFAPESVLNLPGAWTLSQGAGVVVAVIDSGTRLDHPDLAPNIWTNFNEIPGNGIDDDHNGYVDDVHGVDLTTQSTRQDLSDGLGHGTHVAGIIAAAANGRGVVGVAPRAQIMTIKVLDAAGSGTTGAVAEGIRYAAANGARIINLSLQGDQPDPRMNDAIAAAAAANVLVVSASGNSGRDIDQHPGFPASIPSPNLVAVAATGPDSGRSIDPQSNFGRLTVQLAAPGDEILSTSHDGGYEYKSGTSMAAPMVSGVAALMATARPGISAVDLRALLLQYATHAALPIGAGYVDALGSVLAASGDTGNQAGQPPALQVLLAARQGSVMKVQAALVGSAQAISRYRISLDGRRVAELRAGRSPFTVNLRSRRGRRLRIDALDASGRRVATATRAIKAVPKRKAPGGRGIGSSGARVWAG
jgi:subtilisin family serine protease